MSLINLLWIQIIESRSNRAWIKIDLTLTLDFSR